ncbi:DNA polymerase Y family protein [Halospina sp. K52047b]|uniref:Y-family DNA polymerase n=1 Tax=Halospina sp. K52047b TaxID=2614160 RepID=UPI00124A352E|nr:DNA polymerase Y family protein [Halospina sp. K52047b]KAA8984280.1 DNA polymerase Y family protein [Halospina sp. K52047b]
MLWLYLHLPSLLLDHHQSHDAPVALSTGSPPVIQQPDEQARQTGVRAGQSMATARALCPQLALVPFSDARQAELLEQLATALYQLASPLALWPPDGLLIRADRLRHLYPQPEDLATVLTQYLSQHGLNGHMATGTSPRMARLLARHGSAVCTDDPETMHHALRRLPVTATDWPARVRQRLTRMGLQHLEDLLACCPAELTTRLGPELYDDLQRILGRSGDPVQEFHPRAAFHQSLTLTRETRSTDHLKAPLSHLLEALETFLRQRQCRCDRVSLTLHHPDRAPTSLALETSQGETRAEAFLELALLRLAATCLPDDVNALSLATERTVALDATESHDLFDSGESRQQARETLLYRLRARLGRDSIQSPGRTPDPRPERCAHWQPARQRGTSTPPRSGPARPFWLQQPPQPLQRPPIRWLNGPERIQGGWWDGDYVRRDYYIALLDNGQRAWLFRNRQDQWFIHGWFG